MIRTLLLAASLLLSACMGRIEFSPQPPAAPPAAAMARPPFWYVGLGLFDESWSVGDVAAAGAALSRGAGGPPATPVVLSFGAQHRFPPPTPANIEGVMTQLAARAGPDDGVMVYVSTHGAPGLLGREENGREQPPATVEEVRRWLAPLGRRPTVLVLSACFSGSFIPGLQADNRIILTAARRDRTSFGCQAGAEHTVFGAAFLQALATPNTSLRAITGTVRNIVAARERELGVTLPSEPQVSVGAAVRDLFDAPIF